MFKPTVEKEVFHRIKEKQQWNPLFIAAAKEIHEEAVRLGERSPCLHHGGNIDRPVDRLVIQSGEGFLPDSSFSIHNE
jgi:hypothetical protein